MKEKRPSHSKIKSLKILVREVLSQGGRESETKRETQKPLLAKNTQNEKNLNSESPASLIWKEMGKSTSKSIASEGCISVEKGVNPLGTNFVSNLLGQENEPSHQKNAGKIIFSLPPSQPNENHEAPLIPGVEPGQFTSAENLEKLISTYLTHSNLELVGYPSDGTSNGSHEDSGMDAFITDAEESYSLNSEENVNGTRDPPPQH
ncbi:hypothetical protein M9H77_07321 [Catharanthus roseus]|uniref:Uncharacterized protein n=1 Tax=Catharanthus roseus TaxID=4058 RepID=A0ACC0BUP5_CATRO|nr:hypothetical protein M9H77_07321 [Catharanthus roseus]